MLIGAGIGIPFQQNVLARLLGSAEFFAPLTHSAIPTRAAPGTVGTFTRATTSTWPNNDGYMVTGVAGEIGFVGARRIYNLWTTSSVSLANGANKSLTLSAGTYAFSMGAGTGTATFSGTGGATGTLAASTSGRVSVNKTITAGTFVVTASVADLANLQVESLDAQTTQTAGEYVSVGVESAPYYHGSFVDGVKCFPTDLSGNPIPSTTMLGYQAEGARTNHFLQSGTPATQTSGSLSTGTYTLWMDGTGSIAVAGATATITGAGTATSSTAVTFVVTVAGTVTYTVTGSPTRAQSENGAQRSSYIATTTIAVARNADVLTYSSAGNIDGTQGWCYAEASAQWSAATGVYNILVGIDTANRGPLLAIDNAPTAIYIADGTNAVQATGASTTFNSTSKRASTWGGSTMSVTGSGAAVASGAFDGNMNVGANMSVGILDNGGSAWFGTIRNVRIGQRQLSASELGAITS